MAVIEPKGKLEAKTCTEAHYSQKCDELEIELEAKRDSFVQCLIDVGAVLQKNLAIVEK